MKIIIPSLDRAQQLHCLFNSLQENWVLPQKDIFVLYKYSNDNFKQGYELLQSRFPDINFILEDSFHEQILSWILFLPTNYIGFFTDDCIFYRKSELTIEFIENLLADEENLCVSLRLGNNTIVQNYLTGELQPSLVYHTNINKYQLYKWRWASYNQNINYGYWFSWDGCFFSSQTLIDAIGSKPFECPRGFEAALVNDDLLRSKLMRENPYMIAPCKSNVIVNTINCVQGKDGPPAGIYHNYSAEDLNNSYLDGQVIDFNNIDFGKVNACHGEFPLVWKEYK